MQDFAGPSTALRGRGAGHGPCIHRDVHGGAKGAAKGGVNVHEESDVPCQEKTLVAVDDLMIFDGCSVAVVFRPQLCQFEVRRCDVVAGEYPGSFS